MLNDYIAIRNILRTEAQIKLTRWGPNQKTGILYTNYSVTFV